MSGQAILLGAGGHARVVADMLRILGFEILGCVAPQRPEQHPGALLWLGDETELERHAPGSVALANGIGSVCSTDLRRKVFERQAERGHVFPALVHPSAAVAPDVELSAGAQVMAGAVIQCGSRIGANVIVNSGAVVDHDCQLGAHSHVAPGAVLSGEVILGDGVHVGTGACIIQGVTVGAGALVAAGASLITAVPPGARVAGVPARLLERTSAS